MMETDTADAIASGNEESTDLLKQKCLSNGTESFGDVDHLNNEEPAEVIKENGINCNGKPENDNEELECIAHTDFHKGGNKLISENGNCDLEIQSSDPNRSEEGASKDKTKEQLHDDDCDKSGLSNKISASSELTAKECSEEEDSESHNKDMSTGESESVETNVKDNSADRERIDTSMLNKDKTSTVDLEKDSVDSEKENKDAKMAESGSSSEILESKSQTVRDEHGNKQGNTSSAKVRGRSVSSNSLNDDIEIIGVSKVLPINSPFSSSSSSQSVVLIQAGSSSGVATHPIVSQGFSATPPMRHNFPGVQSLPGMVQGFSTASMPNLPPGFVLASGALNNHGRLSNGGNISVMAPSVAPPKPKSSLDQIELIRWEIHNRINTRPKYFKPNPSSELGPLAKFLFDIGSDLIKESVYHELVTIQSKKNDDDKLSEKEKEDLEKLKEIEKDLYATIGHLKLKMKKRCKTCHFQTESTNVLYLHKQYPHEESKQLQCAHCSYVTKQAMAYKFHMEAEHGVQPRLHDKKAFYECDMCPYENNQEQKLVLHKQRCLKQFRPLFNLHPSCLSGAEINLCLENIFYKPIVPKNLKLLQQKHAQQQAALAEARRQQAQVQALAAQKNAAALKRQSQLRAVPPIAPRFSSPISSNRMSIQNRLSAQTVRYNANTHSNKATRPTVANMLKNKHNIPAHGPPQSASNTGGFEVCEICGGYVKDRKALRIHFFYAHRIDLPFNLFERTQAPLYCATCYIRFWTAQGLRKHIDTHKEENQTKGVVGKCVSCGHHVLNLLIHMRVVHNRELQHYVNALMCMFCGSHFNTRPEVERHVKSVHGEIDIVSGTVKSNPVAPSLQQQKHTQKKSANSAPVKGSVCVLCNLNFGRNVDLTRHCMRMHHTCMKCGMVVIDKASLLKHTCLSSPSGTRDCSLCGETGFHPAYYVKHLRDKHLKKFSITVGKVSPKIIEKWTKRPCPFQEPEDVLVEISDSSEEDIPLNEIVSPPVKPGPAKKTKLGPACFLRQRMERLQKLTKDASENMSGNVKGNREISSASLVSTDGKGECSNSNVRKEKDVDIGQSQKRKSSDIAQSEKSEKSHKRMKSK